MSRRPRGKSHASSKIRNSADFVPKAKRRRPVLQSDHSFVCPAFPSLIAVRYDAPMHRRHFVGLGAAAAAAALLERVPLRAFAARGTPGPVVETTAGRIRGLQLDGVQAFK